MQTDRDLAGQPLTARELEVLSALTDRSEPTIEMVAAALSLSPGTVRRHLDRMRAKTGTRTLLGLYRAVYESC